MLETIKNHAAPPRFAVSPPGFETSPQVSFCPFFYVFGHLLDMFDSSKHVLWCYSTVKRCFQAHSLLLRSFWGIFWWFWAFFLHFCPKKSQKGSSWRPDACRNRAPLCMNFISGLFFDPPDYFGYSESIFWEGQIFVTSWPDSRDREGVIYVWFWTEPSPLPCARRLKQLVRQLGKVRLK